MKANRWFRSVCSRQLHPTGLSLWIPRMMSFRQITGLRSRQSRHRSTDDISKRPASSPMDLRLSCTSIPLRIFDRRPDYVHICIYDFLPRSRSCISLDNFPRDQSISVRTWPGSLTYALRMKILPSLSDSMSSGAVPRISSSANTRDLPLSSERSRYAFL